MLVSIMNLFWETLHGYPIVTGCLTKVRVLKLVLIILLSYLYCVCISICLSYYDQAMMLTNASIPYIHIIQWWWPICLYFILSSNDDNQCIYISYPYQTMINNIVPLLAFGPLELILLIQLSQSLFLFAPIYHLNLTLQISITVIIIITIIFKTSSSFCIFKL